MATKTLNVQVHANHAKVLAAQTRTLNFVWNSATAPCLALPIAFLQSYPDALSCRNIRERGTFLPAFDMHAYTIGAFKELGLHSQTVQCIAAGYLTRRRQFLKARLAWHKSSGLHHSLGWVPFHTGAAHCKNGQVYLNVQYGKVWDREGLFRYRFRADSFSKDAQSRWYFNVVVEVSAKASTSEKIGGHGQGRGSVGIGLGCKENVRLANGQKVTGRNYMEQLPRVWRCVECCTLNDHDIHAATNIPGACSRQHFSSYIHAAAALGNERLAVGASTRCEGTSPCDGPKGRRSHIILALPVRTAVVP